MTNVNSVAPIPARGEVIPNPDIPKERRFVFVQLLFSLAIAEVVRQMAALQHNSFLNIWPSYAHLVLTAVVIATSWMGWSTHAAVKEIRALQVFSWPFVLLLMDLALVAFYFILVQEVERPDKGALTPSARPELLWLAVIMGGYTLWDLLTKLTQYPESPICSACATAYAAALFYFLRGVSSAEAVGLVDGALLAMILAYRAVKEKKSKAVVVGLLLSSVALAVGSRFV